MNRKINSNIELAVQLLPTISASAGTTTVASDLENTMNSGGVDSHSLTGSLLGSAEANGGDGDFQRNIPNGSDDAMWQSGAGFATSVAAKTSAAALLVSGGGTATTKGSREKSGRGGGWVKTQRILDRDGTFAQSRGRWGVSNTNGDPSSCCFVPSPGRGCLPFCSSSRKSINSRRCWDDWFHSLAYTPTMALMAGIFIFYFLTIIVFAGLYLSMSRIGERLSGNGDGNISDDVGGSSFCGMDINNHMEALYFSMSTMTTIGYGVSDYYFGECWTPFLLVLLQVFSAIAFNSLAIGLLFQRMSRGQKRGRTIVFSDKAVMRKVGGTWHFMFRIAEQRTRHIIGAKVRAYCVRHERCPCNNCGASYGSSPPKGMKRPVVIMETAHFVTHPLRLLEGSTSDGGAGSDALPFFEGDGLTQRGGPSLPLRRRDPSHPPPPASSSYEQSILMGLPHVLTHRVDSRSPIMPPRPVWYDEFGEVRGLGEDETCTNAALEATPLMATAEDDVCGTDKGQLGPNVPLVNQEEITEFLTDREAEVIVLIEGTCEVTGTSLQARHSYLAEDIAWNQTFAPCVSPRQRRRRPKESRSSEASTAPSLTSRESVESQNDPSGKALSIDFSQFHEMVAAPEDCAYCPYIPDRR